MPIPGLTRYRFENINEWWNHRLAQDEQMREAIQNFPDLQLVVQIAFEDFEKIEDAFSSALDEDGYYDELFIEPCPHCQQEILTEDSALCANCNVPMHEECANAIERSDVNKRTIFVCNACADSLTEDQLIALP